MKLTALTCTYQRPEAFELCKKYEKRQTRLPDEWLVMEGPEPMREKVLRAIEQNMVTGDALIFMEDDDWYAPGWFAWCEKHLAQYDIVGQGNALYYHVARRWWSECRNTRHASLCNTAINRSMFQPLVNLIKGFDNQFFDTRLWRLDKRRYLHLPKDGERLVVGLKGMPGLLGYSHEHKSSIPKGVTLDPALMKLWQVLGPDAAPYAKFYKR